MNYIIHVVVIWIMTSHCSLVVYVWKPHLTEKCSVLCHRPIMNIADVILCTWTVVCNHLWYYCDIGCHQEHYWKRGSTIFLACKVVPLQWKWQCSIQNCLFISYLTTVSRCHIFPVLAKPPPSQQVFILKDCAGQLDRQSIWNARDCSCLPFNCPDFVHL